MGLLAQQSKILTLCYYGHTALRTKSCDVYEITSDIQALALDMIKTMREEDGIGLAAPQIGKNINIVVIDIPKSNNKNKQDLCTISPGEFNLFPLMPLALINPKLSNFSEVKSTYTEGCLSIPGVTGKVSRPEFHDLDATLISGKKISYRCGGLLARCLQHEYDHLQGILFLDLLPRAEFKSLDDQLEKLKKRFNSL